MIRISIAGLLAFATLCSGQSFPRSSPIPGAHGVQAPSGIAVDSSGDVYVADAARHRVLRISGGSAHTVAGVGRMGFSGDGGPATEAELNSPSAIAIDSDGSLYIADAGNRRVRKVSSGVITTIAGTGAPGIDGDQGPATRAAIGHPHGIAVDSAGTVFLAAEGRIRRIADGVIRTIAGTGVLGFSGDDGPATDAAMDPRSLAIDREGNLYFADAAVGRVRRIARGLVGSVSTDRAASLAIGPRGDLYAAGVDGRIRRLSNGGASIVAGEAEPVAVTALAVGADGNLIVGDSGQSGVATLVAAATPAIASVRTVYAGATLSQNAWVEIRGADLVPANTPASGQDWSRAPEFASGRMPTVLNGISVTVNGIPAYIYFYCSAATNRDCSADQINILTPLDNTQGTVQVIVNNNGTRSAAFTSTLRASAPSFFQWGGRYAVATHANNTGVGPTTLYPGYTSPARPNEAIVLWMTGFGLPAGGLTQGASSQRGNLPVTPVIQFNGITAAVSFAGVVSPGLYQLNVTVPPNVPTGDVPITVTYNGIAGPTTNYITISGGTTAPPTISSFSANPSTISAGQSTTLSWNVANATSISIDNGIGPVTGSTRVVNPSTTTTYRLTATNAGGSVSASVLVTVAATPPPAINSFSASATTITAGQSATLSWSVSNATSVSIDNGIGAVAASGSRSVSPGSTTTYVLTASNNGGTQTARVTISVQAACSITGSAASETYFLSNSSTFSGRGSWWAQGFTLSARTSFQLRVTSDYTVQAGVFAADQYNAFTNNASFQAQAIFDNQFGTQTFSLNPGSYYVGIRSTSTATSNRYSLELDYPMNIPGRTFVDRYLSAAENVGPNGGKLWQPFTIQCGYRYLMDGGNSGLKTFIIPADQLTAFQNNQTFRYYTDYSSDSDDTALPGFYEVKLPAGDYYLVFRNDAANSKAVTYTMERWR